MGRGNQGYSSICPKCGSLCTSVMKYGTRKLVHFTIGGESLKLVPFKVFRCSNSDCATKSFTHYEDSDSVELCGKSIYSKSTRNFVAKKMLSHPISYNNFQRQIEDDFAVKTSISTLYTWSTKATVTEVEQDLSKITVLNTDEKHPRKKK
jgi:hypothetical protein